MLGKLLTLSLIVALTGCMPAQAIHDYCNIAKPILLAKGEAATLTDETAKEILAHNLTFAKICRR